MRQLEVLVTLIRRRMTLTVSNTLSNESIQIKTRYEAWSGSGRAEVEFERVVTYKIAVVTRCFVVPPAFKLAQE